MESPTRTLSELLIPYFRIARKIDNVLWSLPSVYHDDDENEFQIMDLLSAQEAIQKELEREFLGGKVKDLVGEEDVTFAEDVMEEYSSSWIWRNYGYRICVNCGEEVEVCDQCMGSTTFCECGTDEDSQPSYMCGCREKGKSFNPTQPEGREVQ